MFDGIDWRIVYQAVLISIGVCCFTYAGWLLLERCPVVKRLRAELERSAWYRPSDDDQRYLDWLEGQLAGMTGNDAEHEGEGMK